jgi:hypothetical protein
VFRAVGPAWSDRDLSLAVDPSLYPAIEGSADSEVMFFLALTFGLEHDPPAAAEQMVGLVEAAARTHGITDPLQMTIGTSDGETVWAFRYSSEGRSRSLFYSTKMQTLRKLYPDNRAFHCPSRASAGATDTSAVATSAWRSRPRPVGGSR